MGFLETSLHLSLSPFIIYSPHYGANDNKNSNDNNNDNNDNKIRNKTMWPTRSIGRLEPIVVLS